MRMNYFNYLAMGIFITGMLQSSSLGSTCPSTRSIDPKDSTKFFYCIDLPDSITGHVWIPARCNYGLIFEPTLKMCVLNQTEACRNKQEDICNFISNDTLEIPVEAPYTAPDIASILASNIRGQNNTAFNSTNSDNLDQESKTTEHPLKEIQIINSIEKEDHEERSTTRTREVPENQNKKTDINSFYHDPVRTLFPLSSTSTPAVDLPCTIRVRMPNLTDCTRYYLCNITSNKTYSYSCPPQMFFNPYKYICEANASIWCQGQTTPLRETDSSKSFHTTTTSKPEINFCNRPGKSPDPTSNQHYYNCYYNSGKMVWYRMSCPNNLHFCPVLKICTQPSKCHGTTYGRSV